MLYIFYWNGQYITILAVSPEVAYRMLNQQLGAQCAADCTLCKVEAA